ncbi:hypothetical protein [Fusibacter bizertensis]
MESLIINGHFIKHWHPKYDCTEHDEEEYQEILKIVKNEVDRKGAITQNTFRRILDWKSKRIKGHVNWNEFELYNQKIIESLKVIEDDEKVKILISLYGVGIPVASTILHFIYPDHFPIVDIRTVEVLKLSNGLPNYKTVHFYRNTINGYRVFRNVFNNISKLNENYSYREIDRALFAFHKSRK